ncbi:MAG: hypothetical protein CMJ69_15780 [Planctomycetaceae bacterium]|nr:hypothetical protein [Planctomycetaceae bacterium]|tara:strand:- start:4827 stop:5561 length:735 start_codon:yes stop_codon:yes gene_type:complete
MKGAQGIMIAVAMGVVGFVCNWLYLEREASRVELVSFVGVSQPADVKRGDVIQSDDLVPISMPKSHESQLAQVAVLWDQRDLVIGQKAARDLAVSGEAELVMHRDLTTPAIKDINELIADNERVMWLPVDSRTFNPQHVDPGDQVSFRIPEFGKGASRSQPTEAGGKILGPFRILALGNRKGRRDVRQAAGLASGAENVIAVAVKVENPDGKLEPKAETLAGILAVNNFQGVQVLLHRRNKAKR